PGGTEHAAPPRKPPAREVNMSMSIIGIARRDIAVALFIGGAIAGCALDPLEEEDIGTADSAVVAGNGMSLNGMSLNGMSLNGMSLNGMSLNGMSLNGMSLNGMSLNGMSLNGSELGGIADDGQAIEGADLVGAILNGELSNGETLPLRIDSAT